MDECILALSRLLMSCVDNLVHTDFYVSSGGWVGLPLFFMNALKIFARPPNPFLILFFPPPDCRVSGMPFYPTYTMGVLRKKVRIKYKTILFM